MDLPLKASDRIMELLRAIVDLRMEEAKNDPQWKTLQLMAKFTGSTEADMAASMLADPKYTVVAILAYLDEKGI
jgi:hypothetical protein